MFGGGGEGSYNEVARIARFVDIREEVNGWGAILGIYDKKYVILGGNWHTLLHTTPSRHCQHYGQSTSRTDENHTVD